jgi:uncharacterized protein (TIGR02246 family)
MIETASVTTERDKIIALCERLGRAHAEKDADAIVACYAEDALIYDMAPPLGRHGMDRALVSEWLATWDGPITVEVRHGELFVGGDLAYTAALNRMAGTKRDGEAVDLWFRTTMVFARPDGRWRIVHDHSSVPFHMDGSFRAALDLEPQQA